VRRYLLPRLRKYNPKVDEALLRTAAIASDDLDFIDEEVDRLWNEVVHDEKGAIVIAKKGFITLSSALKRYLLRRAVASVLGSLKDIEADHIEDLLGALDKPAGRVIGLPFGLNFIIEYDRYILSKDTASLCPFPPLESQTLLNIPGRTSLLGWNIEAEIRSPIDVETREIQNDAFSAYIDFGQTGNRLSVRSRQPGDRFQPLGMNGVKKLNRFMIDARIPQQWRRRVPVVASPQQVVWIVGYRLDERVKVTGATHQVLCLKFRRD
jgi:tRNA(Ile)-lysidine synthase